MLRSSFGAFLGLALVIGVAKLLGELAGVDEWFMASLGASALLVLHCLEVQWPNHGRLLGEMQYQLWRAFFLPIFWVAYLLPYHLP